MGRGGGHEREPVQSLQNKKREYFGDQPTTFNECYLLHKLMVNLLVLKGSVERRHTAEQDGRVICLAQTEFPTFGKGVPPLCLNRTNESHLTLLNCCNAALEGTLTKYSKVRATVGGVGRHFRHIFKKRSENVWTEVFPHLSH